MGFYRVDRNIEGGGEFFITDIAGKYSARGKKTAGSNDNIVKKNNTVPYLRVLL